MANQGIKTVENPNRKTAQPQNSPTAKHSNKSAAKLEIPQLEMEFGDVCNVVIFFEYICSNVVVVIHCVWLESVNIWLI